MNDTSTRRGFSWRTWVITLAVALIGVASVSDVAHGEHGADQDCAVCQLRHHSAADVSAAPELAPADAPELLTQTLLVSWVAADPAASVPARAPPA